MSSSKEWNERYALQFAGAQAQPRAQRILLSLLGSGQRILDVGCGSGFYTTQFRELGNSMVATDITLEGVRAVTQTGIPVTLSDVEKGLLFLPGLPLRVLGKLIGNLDFLGDRFPSLLAASFMVRAVKR